MQSTALNLRESWKVLTVALHDQRRGLVRAIFIGIVWSAAKVTVPRLTQLAIDRGIVRDGSLVGWSMLIIAAGLVAGLFTALRRYASFTESRRLEQRLRNRIFEHVLHLHVGYHDRAQTGQLMSRASSDLQQVQGFVVMIPLTISNLLMVAAIIVILFSPSPSWPSLPSLRCRSSTCCRDGSRCASTRRWSPSRPAKRSWRPSSRNR